MKIDYFTPNELTHLNELKESLLNSPTKYFFRRVENFKELKKISSSMSMWQWQYINSMLSSLLETFKTLGKLFYSIATLRFSVAAEYAGNAAKMALSSHLKLILSFCLLVLQLVRFVTLVITFSLAQIAEHSSTLIRNLKMQTSSTFKSIASSLSNSISSVRNYVSPIFSSSTQNKKSVELSRELRELKELYSSVDIERRGMYKSITDFREWLNIYNIRSLMSAGRNGQKFFSDKTKPIEDTPEIMEFNETLSNLLTLIDSYPEFDNAIASELTYVSKMYLEVSEHHAKVKLIGEHFIDLVTRKKNETEKCIKTLETKTFVSA